MDHQNMSEHVLCMVLYLIELGLDNQVQDNKEDEVRYGCLSYNHSPRCVDFQCLTGSCASRSLALRSTAMTAGSLAPTSSPICTMSSTL